jgi:dihydroflavonol-4-reductase
MEGCDVVFHSAAYVAIENVNIPLMHEINVVGTKNICQAAIAANIPKLVHFSSIHAFNQKPTNEPLEEGRPLVDHKNDPPYDKTKAAAQRIIYEACDKGLNAIILHPTGIIGPYDFKPSRMGKVLVDIMTRKMLININAGFNWVDVRDVSNTAINCIAAGKQGQHYIIPGEWATFKEISIMVSKKLSLTTNLLTLPFWTAYLALPFAFLFSKLTGKRPSFSRGSLRALAVQCQNIPGTLAKEETGHFSRPLVETIDDTIAWFNENAY